MRSTVRLNFEFPRETYPELKMMCADRGVSFKELATNLLLQAIEEYEDQKLAKRAHDRLKELNADDTVSFHEAMRLAGWDDV